uniref:hypothetical protein n=1 Tax=Marinobacterium profundum TaxID=1714300 RepID=UPI000A843685|nr:hypothetical protein [Marinobacterium profundum]
MLEIKKSRLGTSPPDNNNKICCLAVIRPGMRNLHDYLATPAQGAPLCASLYWRPSPHICFTFTDFRRSARFLIPLQRAFPFLAVDRL